MKPPFPNSKDRAQPTAPSCSGPGPGPDRTAGGGPEHTDRPRLQRGFFMAVGYLTAVAAVVAIGAWLSPFAAFILLPVVTGYATVHFFRHRARSRVSTRWPGLLAGNALLLVLLLSLGFVGLETCYRFI